MDAISKIITKIIGGFRRKEKTAAIFFDVEKAYDKSTKRRHNYKTWEYITKN